MPRVLVAVDRPDLDDVVRELQAWNLLPLVAVTFHHAVALMQGFHMDLLVLDQPGLAEAGRETPGWRGLVDKTVVLAPTGDCAPAEVDVIDPAASPADLAALIRETLGNCRADPLQWGGLEVDFRCREARWMGHRLDISPMQLRLLGTLVEAAGAVVSKTDLTWRLFGNVSAQDERVETHIRRIRQRLAVHAGERSVLLTVRGEGYRLADGACPRPA